MEFILDFLGGFDHLDLGEGHFTLYVGQSVNLQLGVVDIPLLTDLPAVFLLEEKPQPQVAEFAENPPPLL